MNHVLLTLDTPTMPASASATTSASAKKVRAAKATKKAAPAPKAKAKPIFRKPVAAVKKAPAQAVAVPTLKPPKVKHKLARDSFTMPPSDFELIDVLKQRAMNFRHAVKKSELLRAGLQVLAALPDVQLEKALARITPLKTGRPKRAD